MQSKLQHFPIGLFASVMGLAGLSIVYQRFGQIFGLNAGIGIALLAVAYLVFAAVGVTYLLKLVRHTPEVIQEFNHPVKASFFAAVSVSLLLLAAATLALSHYAAGGLWIIGMVLHFTFTLVIISRWITRAHEVSQANPAWFIPVVGNILVPIAGVEFVHQEIGWFFFSIGIFFWIVLFTVVFYRIIFHPPLPSKLMPTMCILIAPPALGFISYTKLNGEMDTFARILLYIAIFFVLLLASMLRNFASLEFYISWWAYTFPLCAVTLAVGLAYKFTGLTLFAGLALTLLAITTLVVIAVAVKTISAFRRDKVCIPE